MSHEHFSYNKKFDYISQQWVNLSKSILKARFESDANYYACDFVSLSEKCLGISDLIKKTLGLYSVFENNFLPINNAMDELDYESKSCGNTEISESIRLLRNETFNLMKEFRAS